MNTQDELKIRDMEILFQPFHSRKLDTPTRIVLPAMTRGFSPGGAPTDVVAAYYQRRAKHEVGLIITEGTFIDEPSASPSSNYPNFFGGAPLRGWKKVLEAVHTRRRSDGVIFPEATACSAKMRNLLTSSLGSYST